MTDSEKDCFSIWTYKSSAVSHVDSCFVPSIRSLDADIINLIFNLVALVFLEMLLRRNPFTDNNVWSDTLDDLIKNRLCFQYGLCITDF